MIELYNKLEKLRVNYFQKDIFSMSKISNNIFIYTENIIDDNSGNNFDVEYTLTLPYECIIISKIEEKNHFNHLKINSAPDIILISKCNNGYKLDILEIKSSITKNKLEKLPNQLMGGYLRIMSLLAPLHLNIIDIDLYVAFFRENIIINSHTGNKDLLSSSQNLAMHNITYWKKNEIYFYKTIDNNFFNKNNIHINKLIYNDYHNNNNSVTITFPKK